ncbi:hypothetical protein HZU72_21990 [Halomonas sp. QX-2]|uniref:Uncharacterized protein n=1 Tax=Vreelandella sedimenti TaxID=2729618 RepID=A0A7Z0NB87_9GAMM|nr:hypothetical protein [Halomonas sedimenti]NYT75060.1 hypothetical protein [Halomonas sedimenti]
MTDEKIVQGNARATTKDENFYIQWGYETVKANIGTANEVLKLLITINVALIGGGVAFLYNSDVPEGFRITILAAFFIGLILAFAGVFPRKSTIDVRMPDKIKAHKDRVLDSKRRYLWAASAFTVFGLLASAMAVSEVRICF